MPTIVLHQWAISPFCGKVRRILEHEQLAADIAKRTHVGEWIARA